MNFHGAEHLSAIIAGSRLTELTYFVTSKCNFRCKHCFAAGELNKPRSETGNELSVDELRSMGPHLSSLHKVNLSGGEPFARPDLRDILLTISNEWQVANINLPTNGSHQEGILETIHGFGREAEGRLRILFSITVRGPAFDSFTGTSGGFDKWETTVLRAREAASNYRNITIGVLSSFNADNQNSFVDLSEYVMRELGIEDFSFGLVRRHAGYQPVLNLDKFRQFLSHYVKATTLNPFLVAYRNQLWTRLLDYYDNPRFLAPCLSGSARAVMSPTGDVYPCEVLGFPQGERGNSWLMGNVRDSGYNLRAISCSVSAREILRKIQRARCHCDDACDVGPSLLRKPWFIASTIADGIRRCIQRRFPANCGDNAQTNSRKVI